MNERFQRQTAQLCKDFPLIQNLFVGKIFAHISQILSSALRLNLCHVQPLRTLYVRRCDALFMWHWHREMWQLRRSCFCQLYNSAAAVIRCQLHGHGALYDRVSERRSPVVFHFTAREGNFLWVTSLLSCGQDCWPAVVYWPRLTLTLTQLCNFDARRSHSPEFNMLKGKTSQLKYLHLSPL